MKVLSISDIVVPYIYSPQVKQRFPDVDLVIGCGDEPYYYLEFLVSALNVPTFFVRGNHAQLLEFSDSGDRTHPHGAIDLHRKVIYHRGLLMAGVEGSMRYSSGPYQYTQSQMMGHVLSITPALLMNRFLFKRHLDVFVTHSPPAGIHDDTDLPHQGIRAFQWLIDVFKPRYHFHGHTHVYRSDVDMDTLVGTTRVFNTYGYRLTSIDIKNQSHDMDQAKG